MRVHDPDTHMEDFMLHTDWIRSYSFQLWQKTRINAFPRYKTCLCLLIVLLPIHRWRHATRGMKIHKYIYDHTIIQKPSVLGTDDWAVKLEMTQMCRSHGYVNFVLSPHYINILICWGLLGINIIACGRKLYMSDVWKKLEFEFGDTKDIRKILVHYICIYIYCKCT